MKKKIDAEVEEEVSDSIKNLTRDLLKKKDIVYNNDEIVSYRVSTGSYGLDALLKGGIKAGDIVRLIGYPTCGKSSIAFKIMQNAFKDLPRVRGILIPAEGRFSEGMQERVGINFVRNEEDWKNKTCLVLELNAYETLADYILAIVKENREKKVEDREIFVIFIDPLDGLQLEADAEKGAADAYKVAGPQVITKKLWGRLSLPFHKGGHIALISSQVSAAPKLDPYSKDPVRQGQSSGGFAIQHYADVVIELMNRNNGDYILENQKIKYDHRENDKIGHKVSAWIRKSDAERYDVKVEYYVKYGRKNGESIWVEKEISEWCQRYSILYRKEKGYTLYLADAMLEKIRKIDPNFPEKFKTVNDFEDELESNKPVTNFLHKELVSVMTA